MSFTLFQLGGNDWTSTIIFMLFWFGFFIFYPRLMLFQIVGKLEASAKKLEEMSAISKRLITREVTKSPTKAIRDSINRFFEFFIITPVSLDPAGIVKKFDHVIITEKKRFSYFVKNITPNADSEKRASIEMGFAAGISLYQITKIVRHYVELVKQTKSMQLGMVIQMQIPLIERIAKAMYKGSRSLSKGEPVGDGIGPLVIAHLIGNKKTKEIEEDIVMTESKLYGRNIFLVKAVGPGGRIGFPGKGVEKLIKKYKIAKLITIDAAAKLEGEKTGSIAEGVGVAMGGPGVERYYIEDIVVKKNIPLDSIIVKMSLEQAITPMRKAIKDAIPEVNEAIKRSLETTKKGDNVIIVGVGNTSGVGNSKRDALKAEQWIEKNERRIKAEMAAKKRGKIRKKKVNDT